MAGAVGNDSNRLAGDTSTSTPENIPIPDPSARSTEALEREIMHLRELLESRLDTVDKQFLEQDKAVSAALAASHKAVVELEQSITRRLEAARDVVEAKYVTYRTLLDSNAEKVQAALQAADKAVSAAFASSKEAISKAELFNEKRFDILTKQIDELKAFREHYAGRSSGQSASWGMVVGGVSVVGALLGILIIVMNMVA